MTGVSRESDKLLELSDDQLRTLAFVPWQSSGASLAPVRDADGFPLVQGSNRDEPLDRVAIQEACWDKFFKNPQINTSIRGTAGRLAGMGFEITSEIPEIGEAIEETEEDPRNRLYNFWPKYVARSRMEGELFLSLACHDDGFIEVDFVDPMAIQGGDEKDGIVFHPKKTVMPLVYFLKDGQNEEIVPSVFIARYPELMKVAREVDKSIVMSRMPTTRKKAYKKIGGFNKFIVSWDQGFITRRNVSHLRTILEWINNYELLKQYEIDHKRSAGAYLWVAQIEDVASFRLWLGLTDAQKRETGLGAKKTPGGTVILPPGMTLKAINPNLPKISEQDTDIMHMVTAGLNEPEDVTTGQSKGTFASVKASRGPMSDRVSDEVSYFERFIRHDFYGSIFFLKSKISSFPEKFKVNKIVGFEKQKEIRADVMVKPEKLLEISFPKSDVTDAEARARAFLGVKHGSTNQVLGISNKKIAGELGIGNYHSMRVENANEAAKYPELLIAEDDEAFQEKTEAEPGPGANKKKKKPVEKPRPTAESQPIHIHLDTGAGKKSKKYNFIRDEAGYTASVEEVEEEVEE